MSGPKEKQAMTKSAFIKEVHDAEAMLYHVAKSILKNDADCCDAVQETLLKAYEKLDTLKKEKFFRTWITRILINECNGIIRKRKISFGDHLLSGAKIVAHHPNLYAVYLTNHGCGPNTLVNHMFREEMGDRPYLQIEVDEQYSAVGIITRIEAFLNSISHRPPARCQKILTSWM